MPEPLIKHDETMCMGVVGGCACLCGDCDEVRGQARELWRHRPRRSDGAERLGAILSQLIDEASRLRDPVRAEDIRHDYQANRAPMDSDKQLCLRCGMRPADPVHR